MKVKKKLKIIVTVTICISVAAIIGADIMIRSAAKGRTYYDVTSIPYRRVGILLGCSQQLSDSRQNLYFSYRITAATQLFKAGKVDYIIVSGDNHAVVYDEPTDMKHALVAAGIPAERIYCDYAGFRTLDSIIRAKDVFGQTNVTVISQRFHNQRAIYIAQYEDMDALGFNAREVDSYKSFRTKLREQFAKVKTVLDVCVLGTRPKFGGRSISIGSIAQQTPGSDNLKVAPHK